MVEVVSGEFEVCERGSGAVLLTDHIPAGSLRRCVASGRFRSYVEKFPEAGPAAEENVQSGRGSLRSGEARTSEVPQPGPSMSHWCCCIGVSGGDVDGAKVVSVVYPSTL